MPEKPNSQQDTDHSKIFNDMIRVTGACEHNLKNLSLDIPKGTLTAVSYTHLTLPTKRIV